MWKVLLVEDEVFVRESVRRIIDWESIGFTVVGEAGDGEEAYRLIESEQPDVVISDIIMPKMNGVQLLEQVRASGNDCRFVMLSCMSDFEYVRQAMEYGASNYILKLSMKVEALKDALVKVDQELKKLRAVKLSVPAEAPSEQPSREEQPTNHPEVNKILAYIQENYTQDITLKQLASMVAMDVKYVSQLFKKKTGENLIHYLHKVRITKAQWYLLHSKLTVNDIALKVGFENGNYFIKIFKRFSNGVTPYQYRKDGTPSE